MSYIVVDFEWNQAMRSDSPVFNRLPIHLRGEIIEIGAVRLNEDMTPGEEFTVDVRPVYFRQMHYKVKKLTGFDKYRLSRGVDFPEAVDRFMEFCGPDPVFITWGSDDHGIFEQNIIIHDLDYEWIKDWINLQLIYNVQTGGDKNQKSLSDGMEHFGIEQTRTAHDALGDAYNTALICSKLDMKEGLNNYRNAGKILASRIPVQVSLLENTVPGDGPLVHDSFGDFETKAAAFADERISKVRCPACEKEMTGSKWISQGDGRYMNLYSCDEHGKFLVRVRFKKSGYDNTLIANRLVYEADDEMLSFYKDKSAQSRRRGRSHHIRRRNER